MLKSKYHFQIISKIISLQISYFLNSEFYDFYRGQRKLQGEQNF